MNNYIVHLSLDESSKSYVRECILGSANHADRIFLLTRDSQLKDCFERTKNVTTLLITDCVYEDTVASLEEVFYHDGINPKSFDFNCFLRHLLVANYLDSSSIRPVVFQDSDILLTSGKYFNNLLDLEVINKGIATRSAQSVYFSAWNPSLYAKYASLPSMIDYFDYCRDNSMSRCSDMTYFKWWCGKNDILVSPNFHQSRIATYDPLFSQFLFACSSRLWKISNDLRVFSDSNGFINDFYVESGDVLDSFMRETLTIESEACMVSAGVLRELVLETLSTAKELGLDEYCNKLIGFHSLTYGNGFLNRENEVANRQLAYVHLQGPAKRFAKLIFSFFSVSL
jgi:hypothetical protein